MVALLHMLLTTAASAGGPSDDPSNKSGGTPPSGDIFAPSLFHFASDVKDDREDSGAGWQVAIVDLRFVDWRYLIPHAWNCPVKIGMPLRTTALGQISPDYAAKTTAAIASQATRNVIPKQKVWMAASFCIAFIQEMNEIFKKYHRSLGARVEHP